MMQYERNLKKEKNFVKFLKFHCEIYAIGSCRQTQFLLIILITYHFCFVTYQTTLICQYFDDNMSLYVSLYIFDLSIYSIKNFKFKFNEFIELLLIISIFFNSFHLSKLFVNVMYFKKKKNFWTIYFNI